MTEEVNLIPSSFDDFVNPEVKETEQQNEKDSLDSRFERNRLEWLEKIKNMSESFKNVFKIGELQTMVYTERQIASEYYHYLISILIKVNKEYRKVYAQKYNFYSWESQKRFPNETTKNNQILSEMDSILHKREAIENHSKYMLTTISSIDNIIYGIKSRIEIEQIARGK